MLLQRIISVLFLNSDTECSSYKYLLYHVYKPLLRASLNLVNELIGTLLMLDSPIFLLCAL